MGAPSEPVSELHLGNGGEEVWVLCVIISAFNYSDLFDCSCDIGFPSSHALI